MCSLMLDMLALIACAAAAAVAAAEGGSGGLDAGLVYAGCPEATVPWPTADPTKFACEPQATAADAAYTYLLAHLPEFDAGGFDTHCSLGLPSFVSVCGLRS